MWVNRHVFSQSIPNFISLSGNKSIFLGFRFACKHNKELPVFLAKVLHLFSCVRKHTPCMCVCVSQTKFNYFIIFLGSDCEWMGRRSVYVIKSTCLDVVFKAWAPLESKCSRISNNTLSFRHSFQFLFFYYFFFFIQFRILAWCSISIFLSLFSDEQTRMRARAIWTRRRKEIDLQFEQTRT